MPKDRLSVVSFWMFVHHWIANGMTAYEPSFISDWITAKAQDNNKVEFYVPFTDIENATEAHLPVKVIVEVKVEDGDYYIFNAFGSSPRDDDASEEYGGVIYFYNASGVLILLPEKYENDPDDIDDDKGYAVYLGKDTWYQPLSLDGDTIQTKYSEASVRVKMWRQNDMPPSNDTDFKYLLRSKNNTSKILCPDVTIPPNSEMVIRNYSVNGTLTYTCKAGFEHTFGNLSRKCLLNGSWSGDSPICSQILCPAFQNFENGVATHATLPIAGASGVPVHSIVYFTCIGGFRLSSHVILTCLYNGSWSESPPVCLEIFCLNETGPVNGRIEEMNNSVNGSLLYSCDDGFEATSGNLSRECTLNGTWSGEPPVCAEEVCQDPNTPQNSTLLSVNRYLNGIAHFACNAGFQHTNGSLQRECLSSREWSGVAPVCTFIRECMCPCGMVHVPKYTDINDEKLAQEIEQMKKELKVLKNQTSAALRKKISVKDFRPSANASGAVWVVVLMVIAGCIIVPDLIRALRHILSCCRPRS